MKSKHCTYGKKSAFCAFVYRGLRDNFRPKSNVTAPRPDGYTKKKLYSGITVLRSCLFCLQYSI